jgi:hypothetical protein
MFGFSIGARASLVAKDPEGANARPVVALHSNRCRAAVE